MPPCKNVKVSECQREVLLDFMMAHREFAMNRLLGPLGRKQATIMWEELAKELNAVGTGATKEPKKWKTSWSDWKLNTKSKASGIVLYARGTGGGEPPITKLTILEEKLLEFLGPTIVTGDLEIAEAGFPSASFEEVNVFTQTDEDELGVEAENMGTSLYVMDFNGDGTRHYVGLQGLLASTASTSTAVTCPPLVIEPETVKDIKRKKLATRDSSKIKTKRRCQAEETAYDRAAGTFKDIEEDKLTIIREIRDTLKTMSITAEKKLEVAERKLRISERKAVALERLVAMVLQ